MGFSDGPTIVTNGLVLSLDAADKNSYPGSGTAWNDLSGNNNTGTLINGPTFSSVNNGGIVFDGTNDYAEITTRNTALEFQPTQPYSVFVWFKGPSAQQSALISNMDNNGVNIPGWDIFFNNATPNTIATHLIASWVTNALKVRVDYNYTTYLNQWVCFGFTYDGSSPTTSANTLTSINFYFNGSLYTSGKAIADAADGFNTISTTITYNTSQRLRIAGRWASGVANNPASVTVNNALLYNRVLSATEIAQNYNAQKSRFGL